MGGPGHGGCPGCALLHMGWESSHRCIWSPMNMGQVVSGNLMRPCPWLSQNVKCEEEGAMENL